MYQIDWYQIVDGLVIGPVDVTVRIDKFNSFLNEFIN